MTRYSKTLLRSKIFLKRLPYMHKKAEGMTAVLPWFSALLGDATEMYFTFLKHTVVIWDSLVLILEEAIVIWNLEFRNIHPDLYVPLLISDCAKSYGIISLMNFTYFMMIDFSTTLILLCSLLHWHRSLLALVKDYYI